MQIQTLTYRTEFFFLEYGGKRTDFDDCCVFETPDNPAYHWGNSLFFPNPPQQGDLPHWKARFREAFAHAPLVRHITFCWENHDGLSEEVIAPFLEDGFASEENDTLITQALVAPQRLRTDLEIRPLRSDADWEAAFELYVLVGREFYTSPEYPTFSKKHMQTYRRLTEEGFGHWYGAFLDGQLVADLGLYRIDNLARFQSVKTHPQHRKQGVCSTLVYHASREGLAHSETDTLVICARSDSQAGRIYRRLGFSFHEQATCVICPPAHKSAEE